MEIKKFLENKIFSVSEFNDFVNSILLPLSVVVEGEVSEYRVSQNKFVWFTIKDREQSLGCFSLIFKIHHPVEEGMKVRVWGYPKIYGRSGRYSFVVERLELSGEGSLKRAFDILRKKLEKEGIFDIDRKRQLPPYPQIIGLITSPAAAAYTDFVKGLKSRLGGIEVLFVPVSVQGASTVKDVVGAFEYFNHAKSKPDVIVLTRGGGSLEDLQEFNSEEIARTVFASKIPVLVAIGHERDTTLAELAADLRASTPTQAAQLVTPSREELTKKINVSLQRQTTALDVKLSLARHSIQLLLNTLREAVLAQTYRFQSTVQKLFQFLNTTQSYISRWEEKLESLLILLKSLAPEEVLKRGYSIVRKNGKIIKQARELQPRDLVEIQLLDGLVDSSVKTIRKHASVQYGTKN